MSLNSTPNAERIHIGIFGKTNSGKSRLINAITGQELALVSDISGTTTDPVSKAMELLPLGPVILSDTAGTGDSTPLGAQRYEKTLQVLRKTDIALFVSDIREELSESENTLLSEIKKKGIPIINVRTKKDLADKEYPEIFENEIQVSAETGEGIEELKEKIAALKPEGKEKRLVGDLISENDTVVLVVPIDSSAPKGRLILPQQQTIRDILESGAKALVTRDTEYEKTLKELSAPPRLVITDSQAFKKISALTPESIPLTSFSILFSRYKGDLEIMSEGALFADKLKDGDKILVCEGCTHHRQCEDIGTVKIPNWLKGFTGKKLEFSFTSGGDFPRDISEFALIIHCGACTLNEKEVQQRIRTAIKMGIPITNYGMMIAHINGILKRSLEPLGNR